MSNEQRTLSTTNEITGSNSLLTYRVQGIYQVYHMNNNYIFVQYVLCPEFRKLSLFSHVQNDCLPDLIRVMLNIKLANDNLKFRKQKRKDITVI